MCQTYGFFPFMRTHLLVPRARRDGRQEGAGRVLKAVPALPEFDVVAGAARPGLVAVEDGGVLRDPAHVGDAPPGLPEDSVLVAGAGAVVYALGAVGVVGRGGAGAAAWR